MGSYFPWKGKRDREMVGRSRRKRARTREGLFMIECRIQEGAIGSRMTVNGGERYHEARVRKEGHNQQGRQVP